MDHNWNQISVSSEAWNTDDYNFYVCLNCGTLKASPKLDGPGTTHYYPAAAADRDGESKDVPIEIFADIIKSTLSSERPGNDVLSCGEIIMKDVLE